MLIRQPAVSGHFYPANPKKLKEQIQSFQPKKKGIQESVLGIIAPHAGYNYCGQILVATYQRVIIPESIVILGPNHSKKGEPMSVFPRGVWQTPFGDIEVDSKLAGEIKLHSKDLKDEPEVHET